MEDTLNWSVQKNFYLVNFDIRYEETPWKFPIDKNDCWENSYQQIFFDLLIYRRSKFL